MTFHLSACDEMNNESCRINLWINHNPTLRPEVIAGLWEADRQAVPHDRILSRIVVTHQQHFHPAFAQASHGEVEGYFETAKSYVEWALGFASKHGINTIVPSHFSEALIANQQAFADIGVTILHACGEKELAVAENRPSLYRYLSETGEGAWVPAHATWKDDYSVRLADVVAHVKNIAGEPPYGEDQFCVLPASGPISERIFKLVDQVDHWHALEYPDQRVITVGDFGQMAHSHALKLKMNKEWLVMKYLPQVAITIDCLAWNGELLTHVSRVEDAYHLPGHLVVDNPLLKSHVESIAILFKMNGVFTVKFLQDSDYSLKVLSVTTGLPNDVQMNSLAGVDLSWLWLKLHDTQGTYAKIPQAVAGRRLAETLQSLCISQNYA